MKAVAGAGALAALGYPSTSMPAASKWSAGELAHLIPAASHERFLIKASFKKPLEFTPRLTVRGKHVNGFRTDSQGRFWRFDVPSLTPNTTYELRLTDPGGGPLCEAWPLKTFPAPSAGPERLRILAYTCAGGFDGPGTGTRMPSTTPPDISCCRRTSRAGSVGGSGSTSACSTRWLPRSAGLP